MRKGGFIMSDYHGDNGHCWECDGNSGHHYPGCTYDGTGSRGSYTGFGGSGNAKFVFGIFFLVGTFVAVLCAPVGIGIILLGAKITNV
jgi:hypothetical protein